MKFHVGILIQNSHVRSHQRELYFLMKSEMRKWMRINNSRWWEPRLKELFCENLMEIAQILAEI